MARQHDPRFSFKAGMVTETLEDGGPRNGFPVFRNLLLKGQSAVARRGMVGIGQTTGDHDARTYDGTSADYVAIPMDSRVWTLGLKWTVEFLIAPTSVGATDLVFKGGATTPCFNLTTVGTSWTVDHWDTAGTNVTMTSDNTATTADKSLRVVRDGVNLSLYVNGVLDKTVATLSSTLGTRVSVGDLRLMHDGSNGLNGVLDYMRVYHHAKTDSSDMYLRHPNPRAKSVMADYTHSGAENTVYFDRARFENHGIVNGAPPTATELCHGSNVIQGMEPYLNSDQRRRVLIVTGGLISDSEVN